MNDQRVFINHYSRAVSAVEYDEYANFYSVQHNRSVSRQFSSIYKAAFDALGNGNNYSHTTMLVPFIGLAGREIYEEHPVDMAEFAQALASAQKKIAEMQSLQHCHLYQEESRLNRKPNGGMY